MNKFYNKENDNINNEKWLRNEYINLKKSIKQIADEQGCGKTTISRRLKRFNIATRGPIYTGGKKKVNEDFFNQYGEKQAYYAELINCDGCIYISNRIYSIELVFKLEDREILEKFKKDIESEHNIVETISEIRGKKHEAVRLRIGSKKLVMSLIKNFGILPRKSKSEEFVISPRKYHSPLCRASLDGDGSIYFINDRPNIAFYGSKKKLERMKKVIFQELNILGNLNIQPTKNERLERDLEILNGYNVPSETILNIVVKHSSNNLYRLDYRRIGEVEKLLAWVYDGANIYFNRKFEKYQSYKNNILSSKGR